MTLGRLRYPSHESRLHRSALVGTWIVVVAIGVVTYYEMRNQPFYYDAKGYVEAARGIANQGLLSEWPGSEIRTYGLPLLLSWALAAAQWLDVGAITTLFPMQWGLLIGSAWLASRVLFAAPYVRLAAFAAVAANPLLVIYTPQALTESLTLTCVLFAVAALGHAAQSHTSRATGGWLAAGAAASAFAVEVRPANLLIPVCYALAATGLLAQTRKRRSSRATAATLAAVVFALALPLGPQLLINQQNYQEITPLVTADLAGLQATFGVQLLRYATNVGDCGENSSLFFLNPFDYPEQERVSTGEMVRYYAFDWPQGPQTAAAHVFSGYDPRPFLTYQSEYGTTYERLLQVLVAGLVVLACVGMWRVVPRIRQREGVWRFDALFLGAVGFCALGILATSAAEHRFGVVPLMVTALLAAAGAGEICSLNTGGRWAVGVAFAAASLAWMTVSDLLLNTSILWQACS